MKKLALTITAVVAFALNSNAQAETKKKDVAPGKTEKSEGTGITGTSATADKSTKDHVDEQKTDKTGTRMAINEKALPAEKKVKKTNTPK
jgi:hypothetical protein